MESVRIESPKELARADKEEFVKFVKLAGEVPGITFDRVEQTVCLARYFSRGQLLGTAALKRPLEDYREGCFSKAGLANVECRYPFELGYVVVQKKLKGAGLSHLLVAAVLSHRKKSEGTFATSETSNFGMHRVLDSRHFERAGRDWSAPREDQPNRRLALFLSPGVEGTP